MKVLLCAPLNEKLQPLGWTVDAYFKGISVIDNRIPDGFGGCLASRSACTGYSASCYFWIDFKPAVAEESSGSPMAPHVVQIFPGRIFPGKAKQIQWPRELSVAAEVLDESAKSWYTC